MNQPLQLKRYFWDAVVATMVCSLVTTSETDAQPDGNDWVERYEPHVFNEMPYRLLKPIDFDADKRYPVIVSLHGGGGRGTDNRKQLRGWNRLLADEQRRKNYPSYVLAPQVSRLWNAEDLAKDQGSHCDVAVR